VKGAMIESIVRLISITLVACFLILFAVVFIRWLGSQQKYEVPSHTWFKRARWTIVEPPVDDVCSHPEVPEGDILAVKVERTDDFKWRLPCKTPEGLGHFLDRSHQPDLLLIIDEDSTEGLDDLVQTLSAHDAKMRFAISASAQSVARYLRKMGPQWLFAADSASLLRLHLFESLWMEPAMDFWPDFVLASSVRTYGARLSRREIAELHRRRKRVIWNEAASSEAPPPEYSFDGVLTKRTSSGRE
jgi:hypothetical protein